ncbi:DNA-protecting protein DprA [Bifidobacterium amazonense]|uniref:DNA-protecting protein DprA n=1 Tax=Bifidobacterium amazonense TaxID=2809027 RepID=A0ABS9VSK8_9BIFI|nr:DNA-processing protein DprA [Bifidobacterium amazonense]MCH9275065.1 DNA-protecting protein DprA [Bifidobacterium amazonense]
MDGTTAALPAAGGAPDDDALARAVLTCCLDGADAIMYATIKGASDGAREVLSLLAETGAGPADGGARGSSVSSESARTALEERFVRGLVRWGRKPTPSTLSAFRGSLDGWRRRLSRLDTLDDSYLAGLLTEDGRQWIIAPGHPCWPEQLADLSIRKDWAAPLCLWGLGDPGALVSCAKPVGVVGSRGANEYGRAIAREVGRRAAADGHLVVSGGAMGADAAAHWGALAPLDEGYGPDATGRTVAVFAGGLNHVGPHCNLPLFERITACGGALISEMSPDTIPEARRFLLRNRIIAAMASTVVVVQARLRSGALNTANWATELGRDVYAAPGGIDAPHNAGCNRLIHDNQAILLMSARGIDEYCHPPHMPSPPRRQETADASAASGVCGADEDHAGTTGPEKSGLDAVRQAVRRCRRSRGVPSVEAVAAHMDGSPGLSDVIALLGELELDGTVSVQGGIVSVTAR